MEAKKRVRDHHDSAESELESSEAKRLRESLLELLDDADPAPPTQDLDSVMKSLQEEIAAPFVDLTSDFVDSPSEATGDGFHVPTAGVSLDPTEKNDSCGIGELWSFENQIPSYDSFELGTEEYNLTNNNNKENNIFNDDSYYSEYVASDGVFDIYDAYYDYDSAGLAESWRYDDLPEL
ncbi:hypothetical protein VNO78_09495 [Psophocarpus tetragonolobus]|uniref:Uncharacterized protein n=1 Tax=Psophocarpus tetragonolobus TaxID=3891 RepID=A0AAN9XT97_PSOTE